MAHSIVAWAHSFFFCCVGSSSSSTFSPSSLQHFQKGSLSFYFSLSPYSCSSHSSNLQLVPSQKSQFWQMCDLSPYRPTDLPTYRPMDDGQTLVLRRKNTSKKIWWSWWSWWSCGSSLGGMPWNYLVILVIRWYQQLFLQKLCRVWDKFLWILQLSREQIKGIQRQYSSQILVSWRTMNLDLVWRHHSHVLQMVLDPTA